MAGDQSTKEEVIIWTPPFLLTFAAIMAGGLSGAALLTQLWLNGHIGSNVVLSLYVALVIGSALLLVKRVKNSWLHAGGVFTCLWCILLDLHVLIPAVERLDSHTRLVEDLDIAMELAFLGAASCFSVATTQFRRFDSWFFGLLPLIGVAIILWEAISMPLNLSTGGFDESLIVPALLYLGIIIWWFRPANWQEQPGVTLLSGIIPLFQLLFEKSRYDANDVSFFIAQVLLIFSFLVILRILQAEQCLFVKREKFKSAFHAESR